MPSQLTLSQTLLSRTIGNYCGDVIVERMSERERNREKVRANGRERGREKIEDGYEIGLLGPNRSISYKSFVRYTSYFKLNDKIIFHLNFKNDKIIFYLNFKKVTPLPLIGTLCCFPSFFLLCYFFLPCRHCPLPPFVSSH